MIVDTQMLRNTLGVAKVAVAKKEFVEGMGSYLYEGGRVSAFNEDIAVSCWSPLNINGAVNADSLYPIIKESRDTHIDIYCVDSTLHINGKETSARLPLDSASDILSYIHDIGVPPINSAEWAPVAKNFTQQLKTSLMTISKNMAKPALTCVHWDNDVLETTDNYSVTRCTLATTHPHAEGILISGEAARALLKFDPIAFVWTGDWLHFKTTQDAIFSCRTFDGPFPGLDGCLSKQCTILIEFPPSLLAILKRAARITPKYRYMEREAKISICEGTLTVQILVGKGEFQESCPVNFKDDLIFTVDLDRLKQFLELNGNNVVGFTTYCEGKSGMLRYESENVVQLLIVTLRNPN
ncbi:MAG: hypothetical protein ACLQVJ_03355 [Syntrophobacteraceae bacterium]